MTISKNKRKQKQTWKQISKRANEQTSKRAEQGGYKQKKGTHMQSWLLQNAVQAIAHFMMHALYTFYQKQADSADACMVCIIWKASKHFLMHAWCATCHRQANNSECLCNVHCSLARQTAPSHAWCAQLTTTERTITHLNNCTEALSLLFRVLDMQSLFTSQPMSKHPHTSTIALKHSACCSGL